MKEYHFIYFDGYDIAVKADRHELGELCVTLFLNEQPVAWFQQHQLRCMLIKDA